jgi:endogenous inhibitor of DNA gyrase (YacG/DUF329 family)
MWNLWSESARTNQQEPGTFPRMPRKRTLKLRCPICKKTVKSGDPEFPFCSDRCRTLDLGKWASGAYVIPSPVTDADESIRESAPEDTDEDL